MEDVNVGKALEDSMNRLKRNSDIWDAICDVRDEDDVLVSLQCCGAAKCEVCRAKRFKKNSPADFQFPPGISVFDKF